MFKYELKIPRICAIMVKNMRMALQNLTDNTSKRISKSQSKHVNPHEEHWGEMVNKHFTTVTSHSL